MKPQCFKCFKEFSNIESLCYHLKNQHGLKIIDIYKCVNLECGQEYSSLHRFRSHLKRHLSIKPVQSNNDNSVQNPSYSAVEYFDDDDKDGPSCSQNVCLVISLFLIEIISLFLFSMVVATPTIESCEQGRSTADNR